MRDILKGSTDQSTVIRFLNVDGTPAETVDAGSPGPIFWYRREGAAKALFNAVTLASLSATHSDGGIEHIANGYYRVDVPDAAWASGADGVLVGADYPGVGVVAAYHQLVEFDRAGAEAKRLRRSLLGVALGTVGAGSTATLIVALAVEPSPTSADQFLGKVLTFDMNTTSAALRGQSTRITDVQIANSPTDVQITVDTLTASPASGDTFSIA